MLKATVFPFFPSHPHDCGILTLPSLFFFVCHVHRVEEKTVDGAVRWERLWAKIRSLVCLSVLPLADVVPGGAGHCSCFELFGFDVMVDSRLSRCVVYKQLFFAATTVDFYPRWVVVVVVVVVVMVLWRWSGPRVICRF